MTLTQSFLTTRAVRDVFARHHSAFPGPVSALILGKGAEVVWPNLQS